MPLLFLKFLRLRFIFSLSFFLFLSLYAQPLQFARERIEVEVWGGECILNGTYYLRNNGHSPLRAALYYPFVITPELPFPDSIEITDGRSGQVVQFSSAANGIYFPVSIPAQDTAIYRVYYCQKTPSGKMEYILTSTQKWKRPLETADFIIRIPPEYLLISLSYPFDRAVPDSTGEKDGQRITYFIHKENFMPLTNLIIQWERRIR